MYFGIVETKSAVGCYLAHSTKLPSGRLSKGTRLDQQHVKALLAAGYDEIVAARLDADDVHEDAAAKCVADAIVANFEDSAERAPKQNSVTCLRASTVKTGRVNLFATADGVLDFERERILAVNRIDPAITLAVLPENRWVTAGKMVATVKIIPYAIDASQLEQVLAIIKVRQLLTVAACQASRVALVQTTLPGQKKSILEKAEAITRQRLNRRQMNLVGSCECEHRVQSLSSTIEKSLVAGLDHLLIIGASAISDISDIVPSAVEKAGGEIQRFGLAADPGNLLMLGRIGKTHVLGLPGCARSPKYNGLDPILDRLATGLSLSDEWLVSLSVGGLMTEMLDRPEPRVSVPSRSRVSAVVLAAGSSTRSGNVNKLLFQYRGKPLVCHGIEALDQSHAYETLIVTGFEADKVEASVVGALPDLSLRFVCNVAFETGMAGSIRLAISTLAHSDGVIVVQGDMPLISSAVIDQLIDAFVQTPDKMIFIPTYQGQRGNPVLLGRELFDSLLDTDGDVGARAIFKDYPELIAEIPVDCAGVLADFDTRDQLASLESLAE